MEDVVAWFLTAAALALLVVAGLTGVAVHREHSEAERTASKARAVLLEDAVVVGEPGVGVPTRVAARWTDDGGVARTDEILVKMAAPAGTEVDVWLDANGEVSVRSLRPGSAVVAGIVTAAGLLLGGVAVLLALWFGVRSLTDACNARRWEREWERVGPDWSGRRR